MELRIILRVFFIVELNSDNCSSLKMGFGVWDYVVFITTLFISAGIGVYARFSGGKQKTSNVRKNYKFCIFVEVNFRFQEYLLGNKSMPILPVAFSVMASFISSIAMLGSSSEIYRFGTMFVLVNVSYGIATPIIAYLYLPVFYNLQVTSAYEVSLRIILKFPP